MDGPDGVLAGIVEHLPVGVFALDGSGRVLIWNAGAESLTGWPRVEVVGHMLADSTTLDLPTSDRILAELRAGRPFSGRIPATTRAGHNVYFRAAPGPGSTIVGVLQDVADTVAEDEAFALLDALWETAPVGLAYFDTELRYRRVNGAVIGIDGGTADERIGRTLAGLHGETGAEIAAILADVLADGRTRIEVPVRGRLWHGRGPWQEWRINAYPVRTSTGVAVGVGMVVTEVTETERTRRALAELATQREHALNRYQSLVEATSAAVWIRTADGRAHADAPGLRAITGQTEAEYRDRGFVDAIHPDHRDEFERAWRSATSATTAEVFSHVHRMRTADGTHRWFRTRAVPVCADGRVVEWVGTETDIDDGRRARERRDVLAGATAAMNAALDAEGELVALAEAVVPGFADLCRVYVIDREVLPSATGGVSGRRVVSRTADTLRPSPADAEQVAFRADHPVAQCVRTAVPVLVGSGSPAMSDSSMAVLDRPDRSLDRAAESAVHSMLVAPLVSRGVVVAALLFVGCGDRARYTHDDLSLVGELAKRVSAAVDVAVTYQQTRQVSVTLQGAMLTAVPAHPGVQIEARYLPAVAELQVGGDWYDAFALPGGDLALGVGDVAGHDLPAAVTMGQLRSMLRGLAYDSADAGAGAGASPSAVLARLDRVACGLGVTRFTTLIYGRLAHGPDGPVFRWSNAGHPVPVLIDAAGRPVLLEGVDLVLGVDPDHARRDRAVALPAGSTLLLYTDGLVERRHDPDDRAGARLLELVRGSAGLGLAEFCDHLVRSTVADTGDDIVVLAVRCDP